MPQNPPNITESPEFKEFCKKNNLEVFNQEAINIVLFKQQEMIMEIAKEIEIDRTVKTDENWIVEWIVINTLFDKWNKNEPNL